ncbi:MAG: PRTRC system protein E [Bacteroidetes bacterium]|nr:PRTRC system protein E [Bacteroidota bacterium]
METGFFSSLMELNAAGDWKLTIAKEKEDTIVVSALLYSNANGDKAGSIIPPILLKGTPQEIDEGFFAAIAQPVAATSGLLVSMEHYLKQQERAKAESQMEKDKQTKAEQEKKEQQKRYDEAMKKADELEKEGKYREAWVKVPDPADYPGRAEELRKRKSELSAKFSPDLFNK